MTRVKLPEYDEILYRLRTLQEDKSFDTAYIQIAQWAGGKDRPILGLYTVVSDALRSAQNPDTRMMENLVDHWTEIVIETLIDDPEAKEKAAQFADHARTSSEQ